MLRPCIQEPTTLDLVHLYGVVICDGVKGGRKGAIYRHWQDGANFCEYVTKSHHRKSWLQIKHTYNLNLNSTTAKRGQEGYDTAYKYDYIYDAVIKNVTYFTKYADQDLCDGETSWAHIGYGETESGVDGCVMGKPGMTQSGKTVIVSDVSCTLPISYIRRHKKHTMPPG
jgi:hypothetical protein